MGCRVLIFSEMVQHTTFSDESIITFLSCAISQSFSVVPRFMSMALMPRKQMSELIFLILVMASAPMVILAFFDTRSPIITTSILGCCMYSRMAGMLPEINVALNAGGSARAISIMVVPPLVNTNMPSFIRAAAFSPMTFFWSWLYTLKLLE